MSNLIFFHLEKHIMEFLIAPLNAKFLVDSNDIHSSFIEALSWMISVKETHEWHKFVPFDYKGLKLSL